MRNSRNMTRPATLAAAVVIAIGGISAAGAATRSGTVSRYTEVGQATALRSGDAINGMVSFAQPIHIEVALKMRDRAGLELHAQTDRRSVEGEVDDDPVGLGDRALHASDGIAAIPTGERVHERVAQHGNLVISEGSWGREQSRQVVVLACRTRDMPFAHGP